MMLPPMGFSGSANIDASGVATTWGDDETIEFSTHRHARKSERRRSNLIRDNYSDTKLICKSLQTAKELCQGLLPFGQLPPSRIVRPEKRRRTVDNEQCISAQKCG
jgi:hypothetical protein